jgi:hypothetical protein
MAFVHKDKVHQKPCDASVAVRERVDIDKLLVGERRQYNEVPLSVFAFCLYRLIPVQTPSSAPEPRRPPTAGVLLP